MGRMMAKKEERVAKHWANSSELAQENPQMRMEYLKDTLKQSKKGGLFGRNSVTYNKIVDYMSKLEAYYYSTPFIYTKDEVKRTMETMFEYYQNLIDACEVYTNRRRRTSKGKNRQQIVGVIQYYAKLDMGRIKKLYDGYLDGSMELDEQLMATPLGRLMEMMQNGGIKSSKGVQAKHDEKLNKGRHH